MNVRGIEYMADYLNNVKRLFRESGEWFQAIFDAINESVFVLDATTGAILDVNKWMFSIFNIRYEDALKMSFEDLSDGKSPYSQKEFATFIQRTHQEGAQLFEWLCKRTTGERFWTEVSLRSTIISGKQYVVAVVRDIADRKEAEKALYQKNRALKLLYQCNSAVVHTIDEQKLFHEICRIAVDLAGYRMAWIGKAEHDEKKTVKPITFAGPGREFLNGVFVSWDENEYGHGAAGTAIRTLKPAVGRDLSHNPNFVVWKQAIISSDFAASLAVPLIIDDEVFGVVLIYAAEPDAFDSTEIELFEELSRNISHGIMALRAYKERTKAVAELEYARQELEQKVVERTRELGNKNQEYIREIEMRKATENSLRESERRFRAVFEQTAVGVAIMESKTGRYLHVNQRYCEITNYTEEELLQCTFMSITYPDDLAIDLENTRLLVGGKVHKYSREKRLVRKDGQIVWVQLFVSSMWVTGEEPYNHISVIEDITDRKNVEETLKKNEEKYRELVENANSIILRMDTNGKIKFFNEFAQNFFGFREEEVLGKSVMGTIVPENETSGRDLEKMIREIALYPEKFVNNENENMRKNGEHVWISWTNKPIFDSQGQHRESLCIGNDITDLKRTEAEFLRAKEAAESADHLKSAFLAAMSHELRTPLNSIIGFTGMVLQGLPGPLNAEQKKQLGMVSNSSHRLLSLINDVLDLSKIEAGQLDVRHEQFNLHSSITTITQTVLPLAAKKALPIKLTISPDVTMITGDQRRVEQVLMNLLSNAIKFTDHGEIIVDCSMQTDFVVISVKDTGIGIRPEQQKELFRPFHQLDSGITRLREGTGLGLSICKRLVELMDGSISFTSEFGKGSVFTIVLPVLKKGSQ
jgi:PAS domain S-box-containing protein